MILGSRGFRLTCSVAKANRNESRLAGRLRCPDSQLKTPRALRHTSAVDTSIGIRLDLRAGMGFSDWVQVGDYRSPQSLGWNHNNDVRTALGFPDFAPAQVGCLLRRVDAADARRPDRHALSADRRSAFARHLRF